MNTTRHPINPISLPIRLQRRIEGSFDPVSVFRELVEVPCVTFNEYLVYRFLLDEVEHLREGLAASQRDKLRAQFTEASQLLVSWRGRPDDTSKSVLVAHVDREGFLLRKFDSSTGRAVCWHTAGEPPEEENIKTSRVRLITGDQVMGGTIESISVLPPPTAANPFDHEVVVRVDQRARDRNTRFFRNSFFEGFGHYDIPSWTQKDGIISAIHVDNTAGVSVLVSLLTAVVRNSWRVNVDFLFTACEEAGFCGIVAEILSGAHLEAKKGVEVVCIVIDSSSHTAFVEEETLWRPEPLREDDKERENEIVLQTPVIRTGDKAALYDPEVAKMLCAAATNLQSALGRHDRISWAGRRRPSVSERLRNILKAGHPDGTVGAKQSVRTGRMRGGWCEATPLVLECALRSLRGGLPPLNLRVGSVALPIAHYRNYYKKALYPEKCHESALRGLCQLLGEAVHLCHRWPFRLRGESPCKVPHEERRVEQLLEWQDIFAGLSSVTRDWISQKRGSAAGGSA